MRERHPAVARAVLELSLVVGHWVAYSASRLLAEVRHGPRLSAPTSCSAWRSGSASTGSRCSTTCSPATGAGADGQLLVRHAPLRGDRRLPDAARPARCGPLPPRPPRPGDGHPARARWPTWSCPPRRPGSCRYVDVLSLHASDGWWSVDASAPRGRRRAHERAGRVPVAVRRLGAVGGDLAAAERPGPALRLAGWAYAAGTSVVIVGTGNHWVIDAVVGWRSCWSASPNRRIQRAWMLLRWSVDKRSVAASPQPSRERARAVD